METRSPFEGYQRKNKYLICIDSDGCVMDTMNIKHTECFGPCMITEWNLDAHANDILLQWNQINLFSKTRGINRFKGLLIALEKIDKEYQKIVDLEFLREWVNCTTELSNASLNKAIEKSDSICLKKSLAWSMAVNQAIQDIPSEKLLPFKGSKEMIKLAHNRCDVAIVSSANQEAVVEEWTKHGLLKEVDILLSQNAGSKAYCIQTLLEYGYNKEHVIMVGDAPGDMEAAKENNIYFYPILAGKEEQSWAGLEGVLGHLINGTFSIKIQEQLIQEFFHHLE
jgi:phosphoglycolate phosphatase-like HAD superfamily hydrolase